MRVTSLRKAAVLFSTVAACDFRVPAGFSEDTLKPSGDGREVVTLVQPSTMIAGAVATIQCVISKNGDELEDAGFDVEITPSDDGVLYGVRMLDEEGPRGPLVTSFPLTTARLLAEVPESYPNVVVGSTG